MWVYHLCSLGAGGRCWSEVLWWRKSYTTKQADFAVRLYELVCVSDLVLAHEVAPSSCDPTRRRAWRRWPWRSSLSQQPNPHIRLFCPYEAPYILLIVTSIRFKITQRVSQSENSAPESFGKKFATRKSNLKTTFSRNKKEKVCIFYLFFWSKDFRRRQEETSSPQVDTFLYLEF